MYKLLVWLSILKTQNMVTNPLKAATTLFLAAAVSAQNSVILNSFNSAGCTGFGRDLISATLIDDVSCQQFNPNDVFFSSFSFSVFDLADGCNIVFSNQSDCSTGLGDSAVVIVPNDNQCFTTDGNQVLEETIFANVFCN